MPFSPEERNRMSMLSKRPSLRIDDTDDTRSQKENCEYRSEYAANCYFALRTHIMQEPTPQRFIYNMQPDCHQVMTDFSGEKTVIASSSCYDFIRTRQSSLRDERFESLLACEMLEDCNEKNLVLYGPPAKLISDTPLFFSPHNLTHPLHRNIPLNHHSIQPSPGLMLLICLSMGFGLTTLYLKIMRSLQKESNSAEKMGLSNCPQASYGTADKETPATMRV